MAHIGRLPKLHKGSAVVAAVVMCFLLGSCNQRTPEPPEVGKLPGHVDQYSVGDCYEASKPVIDGKGRVWIVNDNLLGSMCYLSPNGSLTALNLAESFDQRDGAVDSRGDVWMVGVGYNEHQTNFVDTYPEVLKASVSGKGERIILDRSLDLKHIAIGSDDAIWVSGSENGSLSNDVFERIIFRGKRVITQRFEFPRLGVYAITVDKHNVLWYAALTEFGTVNAAGKRTTRYKGIGSVTSGLAINANGDLWFADEGGSIGLISATGTVRRYAIPHTSGGPAGIAFGADRRLWFVERDDDRIGAMTTSGVVTEYLNPASPGSPSGITAAPDGSLWVVSGSRLNENSLKEYSTPYLIHIRP